MTPIKQLWYYLLIEPLIWIRCAFFQPISFSKDFEKQPFAERIIPMLRLTVSIFLVTYPLALLLRATFIPFDLVQRQSLTSFFVEPLFGIGVGIVIGIGVGVGVGIAFGIAFSIVGGIASSVADGITFGIALSIGVGIIISIAVGIRIGIGLGTTISIVSGVILVIAFNIVERSVFNVVLLIGGVLGIYRMIPFYIISSFSVLIAYFRGKSNPQKALMYVRHSALYWDELIYLPLPYLKRLLLMAYDEHPQETLETIIFIAMERSLQLRAARAAMLEIVVRDLEERSSLKQIADAMERIETLLPKQAKLVDPRWETSLARLRDASKEAMRGTTPIGIQRRTQALEEMQTSLLKVYPLMSFRDQRMNMRLKHVIEMWQDIAQQEQAQLRHTAQDIGKIDNPYKPGQVLSTSDKLFIGRRDLAPQLEAALGESSNCPTFLLNGERRMGKTSALYQLPYLLGSRYFSIYYTLQNPAIYANTTSFLEILADGIQDEMQAGGFPVPRLTYQDKQGLGQTNNAYAYSLFSRWLEGVESTLEQEKRILLLMFDEFEKLEEAGEKNFLDLTMLLDWCRDIIQFHPRIALLFSGVKTIDDMGVNTSINWSSYLINVQMLRVSFLTRDEGYQLVCTPTPNHSYQELFGSDVVEKIISETGCHPFLIQAVCSALIDNLNVEKRDHADLADAERAVNQAIESWKAYFKDMWIRTNEQQRTCLKALIPLERANLQQLQQHTTLEEKVVRRTLQALVKRDLVRLEQDGSYGMAVPMFTRWVEEYGD